MCLGVEPEALRNLAACLAPAVHVTLDLLILDEASALATASTVPRPPAEPEAVSTPSVRKLAEQRLSLRHVDLGPLTALLQAAADSDTR